MGSKKQLPCLIYSLQVFRVKENWGSSSKLGNFEARLGFVPIDFLVLLHIIYLTFDLEEKVRRNGGVLKEGKSQL